MTIKQAIKDIVVFWHTQPTLLAATVFFFGAVALLGAALVYSWTADASHSGVLGDYTEAKIQSTVPGITGPAAEERGPVIVAQERCVRSEELIQVEVTIGFRRLDPPGASVPYLERVNQTRAPGCNFMVTTYPLPVGVTPGQWRVEGISRAISTSELRYWVSEPFEVVSERR